ncbi:MAG: class I SAM-dependent RNA methyltransferase [Caulobacteraceae bacterium]|nr:class I SAM-dependent RNA methyltransferase [Caulobacter sp.]
MGAQGDGLLAGGAHVALTLPGERVLARVAEGRGELAEVLAASPERVAPPCPHFGACGGCALQHWEHGAYLAWKVEGVRRTLAREGLEAEILPAFAAAPGSRRRLALHARRGPRREEALLGFKARRSWSLIPVAVCPIAEPALVAALPALRRLAAPLLEHPKSAPTLHVTLTETGLDVDVTGVEQRSGGVSADARLRVADAAAAADLARVTLAGEVLYGAREAVVRFGRGRVALPPGGFLQAVAQAEAAMADFAVEAIAGAARAADLFCGAGAFTFRLAEVATIAAADASAPAIRALTAGLATAPGLKGVRAEARDLGRRPMLATELNKLDAVLFDPPRAGALEQAGEIARSRGPQVCVAVSCNPQTFARDAAVLAQGGWRLGRVLPVDQFLWSPHIEVVGVFTR